MKVLFGLFVTSYANSPDCMFGGYKCTCSCVFMHVQKAEVDARWGTLEERHPLFYFLFCILKTGSLIESGAQHFS